jgi:hypothetical protein
MQRVQLVVVPAAVRRSGDVPVGPVVGHDQPVDLHRAGDPAGLEGEAGDVDARLQAQPLAHPRQVGIRVVGGEVAGGPDEGPPAAGDRHAQRVVDPAGASQQREDGEPGGVRRGPAARAGAWAPQVPGGAGAGAPAPALPAQREQLVQPARAALDEQGVPVAAALDPHAAGDRVAHAVGLGGVVEPHAAALRPAVDDRERDPDRLPLPAARAEIGVHVVVEPDRSHDGVGVRRHA